MTTTPKPAALIPTIAGVKFRESVTLSNLNPLTDIDPSKGFDIAVVGGSVFVSTVIKGQSHVVEVPRSACVIRWAVPEGMTGEEAIRAVSKGGQHFVKAEAKKPRAKPEMLRLAGDEDEDDLRAGA